MTWRDPKAAFLPLATDDYAALLRPGKASKGGEWAIIVANPCVRYEVRDGFLFKDGTRVSDDPFSVLKSVAEARADIYQGFAFDGLPSTPPFVGGLVGYVGYESARYVEPSITIPPSPYRLPDLSFGEYSVCALFHLPSKKCFAVGPDESSITTLTEMLGSSPVSSREQELSFVQHDMGEEEYTDKVACIQEHILDGDFYQANLARTLSFSLDQGTPFDLFTSVCTSSAARFCGFLKYPEGTIVSASPERFFAVDRANTGRRIIVDPIKGTRPRHPDPEIDRRLAHDLRNDPKERAENIMIADLLRNDLSRCCVDESIAEDFICRVITYATVHHLVSRISGVLKEQVGPVDVLRHLFPCGSITGAPKIAAMDAIARAEGRGRGPYCGAIGMISDCGAAHFSVAIRTAVCDEQDRRVSVPVGSGITLKSNPITEFKETVAKAKWLTNAGGVSVRGLN
ncbi:MAG: anthranilate synthase component I family protein [Pseudomonadota bacterium]